MSPVIHIRKPAGFSYRPTVTSHGWVDLAPFGLDREKLRLRYVFSGLHMPIEGTISDTGKSIRVELGAGEFNKEAITRATRHILRLDDDIDGLYAKVAGIENMKWIGEVGAGRMLRSPTVFEDLVKTLCTTNCSWGLTRNMVNNLVGKLGEPSAGGRRAFPTPEAMAAVGEDFYRSEIKAGYRSAYFFEMAKAVHSGEIDPESWLSTELSTAELKKEIKQIKGFGDYAAENLLKLLGRYDGLALDSWLRAKFYERHNKSKVCPDKKIERHYKTFGEWRGLAIWCDMTESWFKGEEA
ncbi:MAG: DNA-3-methyladenine glycosylase family protein [Pyrinomonadaceae bacterium]